MARQRKFHAWRNKLLALLLVFSVTPMLLLAVWNYVSLRTAFEGSALASLEALARARAEAIGQFTEDRRSEVERIAALLLPSVVAVERERDREDLPPVKTLPPLQDAEVLKELGPQEVLEDEEEVAPTVEERPDPVTDARADLRQNLRLVLWDQRRFEELMVIDLQGRVVASTFELHEGHSVVDLDYYQQGLGITYHSPLFISPVTESLTMIVSTPLRDPERGVVGVLAARLNLERFFRLINDVTGLGETGETLVARRIEDEAVFMAPTRHDPKLAALQRRVPLGLPEGGALEEAVSGRSGRGEYVDYRGQETMAAWEHVPSLDWGVVVKIDRSELRRPVNQAAKNMLLLLLLVLAGVVVASVAVSRALVRPLRELKAAADRISRGDFEVELAIESRDEIGELADSFERMVAAIKFFREHSRGVEEEEEPPDEEPPA